MSTPDEPISTERLVREGTRPGPPGGKRDLNRREKARALADAALALFLSRGIEATTIDDITRAAGVAKGSFYRYFADKTELVEAILRPVASKVEESMKRCEAALRSSRGRSDLSAAYTQLGLGVGAAVLSQPDVVRLYLQEARAPAVGARAPVRELADQICGRAVELTAVAHEHGLLRPFPAQVSALAVVGAVEQLLAAWLNGADVGDPARIPVELSSLVLEGLRPRGPGGEAG